MSRRREEQETVIRWDRSRPTASLWTASKPEKRRWEKRGYPVVAHGGGWQAEVPIKAVSLRKLPLRARNPKGSYPAHVVIVEE